MASSKKTVKQGVKHDQHKIRMDLVPYDAVNEIAKILTFGATKYAARNWELGFDWSRVFGALERHLTRWFHGQDKDKETGLTHLANAGCCLFFLLAFELRGVGNDDRPKLDPKVLDHMDDVSFMENALAILKDMEAKRVAEEKKVKRSSVKKKSKKIVKKISKKRK